MELFYIRCQGKTREDNFVVIYQKNVWEWLLDKTVNVNVLRRVRSTADSEKNINALYQYLNSSVYVAHQKIINSVYLRLWGTWNGVK